MNTPLIIIGMIIVIIFFLRWRNRRGDREDIGSRINKSKTFWDWCCKKVKGKGYGL